MAEQAKLTHAVLLRTMDLDVPRMPTGDGDLGVTPGLVGDFPSIEALLANAGYEQRTTARPGLWGREPYDESDGTRSFREKIDLLAPQRPFRRGQPLQAQRPGAATGARQARGRQRSGPGTRRVQPLAGQDCRLRRPSLVG